MHYPSTSSHGDGSCLNQEQKLTQREHKPGTLAQVSLGSSFSTTSSSDNSDFSEAVNPGVSVVLRLECVSAETLKVAPFSHTLQVPQLRTFYTVAENLHWVFGVTVDDYSRMGCSFCISVRRAERRKKQVCTACCFSYSGCSLHCNTMCHPYQILGSSTEGHKSTAEVVG